MNRSILIVICDFLLVSLLAFSTVDINKVADEGPPPQVKVDLAMPTNNVESSGKDLAAVMRLALTEEQKNRDLLMSELAQNRQALSKQQQELQSKQQELQSRDQQSRELQSQQANLQQQVASAQTNIQTLTERLQSSSSESLISKEKLAAMEAELKKQAEHASSLQQELAQLARSNQAVLGERQRLAGQLQVAEVEKRHATEQVVRMQEEVKVEREEKAKLAEGVKVLASKSGELSQEIRENRPLAPNTIFNQFLTNRVEARFSASRSTLFSGNRHKDTQTVLATDGTNIVALCHVQDTPLTLWNPGVEWEGLAGTLARNAALIPVRSLSFHLQDPRVAFIPISKPEAQQLGCKVYHISPDPFKFQDAVLVGASEGYYGECRFEIDLSTPDYVKLDRNFLKGLFGKFNPSRGDLVFSKTGDLLGIMANNTYCMMIRNFDSAAAFRFGPDVRDQHTADTLSLLYARVADLPPKLQ